MRDDYPMAVAYSETMNGVEGKPVLIIHFRPQKKFQKKFWTSETDCAKLREE
jgi:hypothetical protein